MSPGAILVLQAQVRAGLLLPAFLGWAAAAIACAPVLYFLSAGARR